MLEEDKGLTISLVESKSALWLGGRLSVLTPAGAPRARARMLARARIEDWNCILNEPRRLIGSGFEMRCRL